jgi:8-oxo-dGTP diphosphatase
LERLVVAKVVIVDKDGRILLIRRSETDANRPNQWDLPGGHADKEEFAEDAASREAKEETGLTTESSKLKLVYGLTEIARPGVSATWLFFVGAYSGEEVKISNEHKEYAWATPSEAIQMITYERQQKALSYIYQNDLLKQAAKN